ncbi:hypothetical protein LTR28_006830 [Elasticomyces elasticus]|nr:hypothetical protein LTR28_006830 [Elasticomyces elasticus]
MAGRELDYARGKGLGGSSNINFACYTVGPEDDYDEWARLVGDEAFNWESACRRRHTIEVYHLEGADDYQRYAKPSPSDHGHAGPLNIDFARSWERGLVEVLDAAQEHGFGLNLDINLDNPLGIGVVPSIAHRGVRSTAASAFLVDPPPNLTMITNAVVTKIHFVGKKAVGVVARGEDFDASKDIIISAGALDTPKLLMLSGIGPRQELSRHGIDTLHDLPGVGTNLQDHPLVPITFQQRDGTNDRCKLYINASAMRAAREQVSNDGTGPLASIYNLILTG